MYEKSSTIWIALGVALIWSCPSPVHATSCYFAFECPGVELCCSNSYCCGEELATTVGELSTTISMGVIIGIIVGCIIGCIACVVCCVWCCRRNNTYQGQVLSQPGTQVITTQTVHTGLGNPNQHTGYTHGQVQYPVAQQLHPASMDVPPPSYSSQYTYPANPPGYKQVTAYQQPQQNLPYPATQPAYPVGPSPYPGNQDTKQGITGNVMPSWPNPVNEMPQASAPPPNYTN